MKTYKTNYSVAVNWCNNALILCNNITEIDPSVYDNMRFELFDEEDGTQKDIYQWFITDCTDDDVEYLEQTFGLLFTYSDLLDKYILCVDHFGTSWDYVECETTNELAKSFIKKFENKYIERDITFDVVNVDVNDKYYIECGTKER